MSHVIFGATGGNSFFKMSILELGPILFGGTEGIIANAFFLQYNVNNHILKGVRYRK